MISVFDYFDYVSYLTDYYNELKKVRIGFSFRSFSQNAGIPSHSYLLRIIKRQRKLSPKYLDAFIKALNLNTLESKYFTTLVSFNNSNKAHEKEHHLNTILSLRCRCKEEYRIKDEELEFYRHWYYPVIRELATLIDFKSDYTKLAHACHPKITAKQAERAIDYLVKNNFLVPKSDGRYDLCNHIITTAPEVNSTILRKYHKDTLMQTAELLDIIEPAHRDVSSLTLRVDSETYKEIKKEIQNFRKRLLHIANKSKKPSLVCHAGLQLFPRSTYNNNNECNND